MNRIIIICEGQTEQEFCKTLLQRYFSNQNITLQVPLIKKTMGGIANWNVLKREIETYLRREKDVLVTTLIDYYGIKDSHGFPLWAEKQAIADKSQRLDELEAAMLMWMLICAHVLCLICNYMSSKACCLATSRPSIQRFTTATS